MKLIRLFSVLLIVTTFVCTSLSYDLVFNTDKDLGQWRFNGSYIYSRKVPTLAPLLPASLVRNSKENDIFRIGLWLARHGDPDTENYLSLHYALKHHLFKQGIVHFIASPNVPITITTNREQEVGKFWSDGKTWCDAIFTVNLQNSITLDMQTPEPGDYVLLDKIVLGVMGDLQMQGRKFNPCLTSPPTADLLTEDVFAPDMINKAPSLAPRENATSEDHSPPDMINKPSHRHHLRGSSGGLPTPIPPPDMVDKTPAPALDTSTVTTSQDNEKAEPETGDSSDVKCGCSCSCSRVKGKKGQMPNNGTMFTMTG